MISEQVRRNWLQRVQNIMFCMGWAFSCSPVHFGGFWAVSNGFERFLVMQFIIIFLLSYVVVNKDEEYRDSMRQFALQGMNK